MQQAGALGQLGSLSGLNQLGLSPYAAQFAPLQGLSSILGDPTVLQRAQQQGQMQSSGKQKTNEGYLSAWGNFMQGMGSMMPESVSLF